MTTLLEETVERLRWLVACDTTNPPRKPASVVSRLAATLAEGGLAVDIADHGEGCVSILARRGRADVLLTSHVDTVPVAPGWTRDPFVLSLEDDRAYGLGACDVKGGAAAMLAAALSTSAPCFLLFTTDEEAGSATCMRRFISQKHEFRLAVVAEPTRGRAVTSHRGVATASLVFEGRAGHSSQGGVSALHRMIAWGADALRLSQELEASGSDGLRGVRFNIGRVEGGEKPNVVAGRAEVRFGVRPPPDMRGVDVLARLGALAPDAAFEMRFQGPALVGGDAVKREVDRLRLEKGDAVDFWTEAALLAEAGTPAIVLGPGDIAQAHGADEFVMLAELDAAARAYLSILEGVK
jgi:acetylornithine deacetylase